MIAVSLVLAALPLAAQENLVENGDFSAGLEGWTVMRAGTEPALDTVDFHSAPASLLLPPIVPKVALRTPDYEFAEPLPSTLNVSGWLKADIVPAGSRIGLDLKIMLDDGTTTWFFPPALMVQRGEEGQWVRKLSSYVAPAGRRIAATAAFCINYESGGDVRFDDFEVRAITIAEPEHDVAVFFATGPDQPAVTRITEALAAAGIEHDVMPAAADPRDFELVIVPDWAPDDRLYFGLKVHHYLGGRVLLADLPTTQWARAISQYFWDLHSRDLPDETLLSDDGRAAHIKSGSWQPDELAALARELLATDLELPDEVPALDFGPKEPYELRAGALYVGDEPLLFRAMGTYRVDGSKAIELHRANFAHYRELRLNGLVVYLGYATPVEHFAEVLDAAWAEGLRVMVWLYGPPASPYTEKPLKDDWLLRLLPLRAHPAMLGWIMCDDTWHRHLPFVSRTSEVLHRYDDQNLITTTTMDLRRPDNVSEEGWAAWKQTLDFPLTYLYPLQKGRTFGGGEDIAGGLEDVQLLSENARRIWGEPVYVQQWSQAHMQNHATRKLGLTGRTLFVPTCEQQRLLSYMMLTSGTRGILYFSTHGLSDDRLGMGRRAELGLLWGELEPVQDVLAAGTIAPCETSDESVEAAVFVRGDETVILALKHGDEYNRYVSEAVVADLRVELPAALPDGTRCLRLDGPSPIEVALSADRRSITLDELDVTAAVLITDDDERAASVRAHREQWADLAARLALTAAADTQAKTNVVGARIGESVGAALAQAAAAGDERFAAAIEHHRAGDPREAYKLAREAMRHWRAAQAVAMRWAEAEHERQSLGDDTLIWLNIYAALPKFVELCCGGPAYDPAAMRQEVLDALAAHDFLVREP